MIGPLVLGAAVGADRTAFGQTLLAHPVVAAVLACGWAGCPEQALPFALALGLLSASTLPVGEQALRDWSSAAVVLPFALGPEAPPFAWGLGLVFGVVVALAGGWIIASVREWVRARTEALVPAARRGDLGALERAHVGFTLLHPVRGAMFCWLCVLLGRPLLAGLEDVLAGPERAAFAMLWKVAPWVGLPVLFRFHLGLSSWRWIAVGAVAGTTLLAGGVWP